MAQWVRVLDVQTYGLEFRSQCPCKKLDVATYTPVTPVLQKVEREG